MYFANFPFIPYDSVGDNQFKMVTNLLKRVAVRTKVKANTLLFDTYDVTEGETPESIADKLYDNPQYHWVVLFVNNIFYYFCFLNTLGYKHKCIGKIPATNSLKHEFHSGSNYFSRL